MANTSAQHLAESWIKDYGLPSLFPGVSFKSRKLKLKWGGEFAFDAVSEDGSIVATISTSASLTAAGKPAIGKYQKLKTDVLYLLFIKKAKHRLMLFTEKSMLQYFKKQQKVGRFPLNVELHHIPLPKNIQGKVVIARKSASKETSPQTRS